MSTKVQPTYYVSSRPPGPGPLAICRALGCEPIWLPDTPGVERLPSEQICHRCKRYIHPLTGEPFQNAEEIEAWMEHKQNARKLHYVKECSLWLYSCERVYIVLQCVRVETGLQHPFVMLTELAGQPADPLFREPLAAESFVELVENARLTLLCDTRTQPPWFQYFK